MSKDPKQMKTKSLKPGKRRYKTRDPILQFSQTTTQSEETRKDHKYVRFNLPLPVDDRSLVVHGQKIPPYLKRSF